MIPREVKNWLIDTLKDWQFTFESNDSDTGGWYALENIINRLESKDCTREDYENILFHLWQTLAPENTGKED